MKVKQLMQKLKSVPEDYEVTIFITDAVVNGTYKADGIDAKGYVCDVTDEEAVQAMVAKIENIC